MAGMRGSDSDDGEAAAEVFMGLREPPPASRERRSLELERAEAPADVHAPRRWTLIRIGIGLVIVACFLWWVAFVLWPSLTVENSADAGSLKGSPDESQQVFQGKSGRRWEKTGDKMLGKGYYSKVWEVHVGHDLELRRRHRALRKQENFALKEPLESEVAKTHVKYDIAIMERIKKHKYYESCRKWVVELEDTSANPNLPFLVMTKMKGTLHEWRPRDTSRSHRSNCFRKLAGELVNLLECFNVKLGLSHFDIKGDNILYTTRDDSSSGEDCPEGLRLADFGITREVGSRATKCKGYLDSDHMPSGIFKDHQATARPASVTDLGKDGRSPGSDEFTVVKEIDLCSAAWLMLQKFGTKTGGEEEVINTFAQMLSEKNLLPSSVDCGEMGHDGVKSRAYHIELKTAAAAHTT